VCSLRDVHKYGYIHNVLKIDSFVLNKTESLFLFIYFNIYYYHLDTEFPLRFKITDFELSQKEENNMKNKSLSGTSFFWVIIFYILF
jgi:hypothetical protein